MENWETTLFSDILIRINSFSSPAGENDLPGWIFCVLYKYPVTLLLCYNFTVILCVNALLLL